MAAGRDAADTYEVDDGSRGDTVRVERGDRSRRDSVGASRGDTYRDDSGYGTDGTSSGRRRDSSGSSRSDSYGRSDTYGSRGDNYDTRRADRTRPRSTDVDTFSDANSSGSSVSAPPRHRDAAPATGALGGSPVIEIAPASGDDDE